MASERGALTYRFERNAPLQRPASARQNPSAHASGAMTAREPLSSRHAAESGRPAGVSKLILSNMTKARGAKSSRDSLVDLPVQNPEA